VQLCPGAQRTPTNADDGTIVERLEALDDVARRLNYAPLSDTPFQDCPDRRDRDELNPGQWEVT
jgi:hypothetical protein